MLSVIKVITYASCQKKPKTKKPPPLPLFAKVNLKQRRKDMKRLEKKKPARRNIFITAISVAFYSFWESK